MPDHPPRRRTHGSGQGLARPPRGDDGDYPVPMPTLLSDRSADAVPSPVDVPRWGAHIWVRGTHGWAPALASTQDHAGRRVWCVWTTPGQYDTALVEGWVSWDDVRPLRDPEAEHP